MHLVKIVGKDDSPQVPGYEVVYIPLFGLWAEFEHNKQKLQWEIEILISTSTLY